MSTDAVARFLQTVAEDPRLRSELVAFAAERGFDFSAEELSEADLESLAGGLMPTRRKDIDQEPLP